MPATPTSRLEGLTTSVAVKAPCKVATNAAIVLSGEQTVNGVAVTAGDRVLVKNQSSSVDNGIWNVQAGTWTRALDFNGSRDAVKGTIVPVVPTSGGTVFYQVTTANPVTIGSSNLTFATASPVSLDDSGVGIFPPTAGMLNKMLSIDSGGAVVGEIGVPDEDERPNALWAFDAGGETDPMSISEAREIFRGAPGGSADAVGSFTSLSGQEIDEGVDTVRTTRYSTLPTGAGFYDRVENVSFERLGTTSSGSPIVTGLRTTSDLTVGASVTGSNIPNDTVILTIDDSTQVTLSKNATGTTTGVNLLWSTPINAAYVAANSRSSFLDASSNGWTLSKGQQVTLPMFGAVNDPALATDNTMAIQEAFHWIIEHKPQDANITLDTGFSAALILGPSLAPDNTVARNISGDFRGKHIAGAALLECFKIRNLGHVNGEFKVRITGQGGTSFASRLDAVAIAVENCERAIIPALRGDNAWWGGIVFSTASNNQVTVRNAWSNNIGSGHSQTANHSLSGAWSSPEKGKTTAGTYSADPTSTAASSANQRTRLPIDTMMPYVVDSTIKSYMQVTETPTYLRINSFLYQVMAVDTANGTVDIYPWIDDDLGASGTYTWVFGGGIVYRSGDGLIDVDTHHALRCGIGANLAAQYGGHYKGGAATTCGIGVHIGREAGGNVIAGATVHMPYFEGSTVMEHLVFGGLSSTQYGYVFGEHNLDLARVWCLGYPRNGSNVIVGGELGTVGSAGTFGAGWLICNKGRVLQFERRNLNNGTDALTVFRDQQYPHRIRTLYSVNSRTVALETVGAGEYNRLLGYRGAVWRFIGTGPNGEPTGTITFTPPSGGTINGGAADASAAFTGFSGVADFEILHTDTAQLTWIVFPVAGRRLIGSKTFDPGSIASAGTATTTVTVTGAALGNAFVPSFSLDLQGMVLTAYVSASDTVTTVFFNPTAGAIDLAEGTLTVRKVD